MNFNQNEKISFPQPWGTIVTDRPVFGRFREAANQREGIILLKAAAEVGFIPIQDLRNAATAQVPDPDALKLVECFQRALDSKPAFDPSRDVIVGFESSSAPVEELRNKRLTPVRAWWLKSATRSIKRINLLEAQDFIDHQAFEL